MKGFITELLNSDLRKMSGKGHEFFETWPSGQNKSDFQEFWKETKNVLEGFRRSWERLSVDSGGGDFKCFLKPTLEYLNLLFGGCFDGLLGIFDVNPN